MERWLNQTQVHRGPVFSVWTGNAALDDGTTVARDVVRHQGSVAIVPVLGQSIILVRQFRIAVNREVLELPAGRIDAGEDPVTAALRELEEETGYRASRLVPGPSYYPSVGFLDERVHLFFAYELVKLDKPRPGDEDLHHVLLSFAEVADGLASRSFDDAKTMIGLREVMMQLPTASSPPDEKALYSWYSDENHKYNTLIWQFPAAIIGLNILALDRLHYGAALFVMLFVVNAILLLCLAKHVYHQRCFTRALSGINAGWRVRHPDLHVVTFPKDGWRCVFRVRVSLFLTWTLFLLNFGYLIGAWMVLRGRAG